MVKPTDCIEKDFNKRWYKKWSNKMSYPVAKHPKFWESSIIAEYLSSHGVLRRDAQSVVFGAGTEQLVSLFASMGVNVLATDQDYREDKSNKWDNGQLAKNVQSLFYPEIINKNDFNNRVSFEFFDMNRDKKSYYDRFDFIWHNCVIGHLGSMQKSLNHLERSAKYIKDGGFLVFTTELNISNQENTIKENSDTIIWRLEDLMNMFTKLAAVGLKADRFRLRLGTGEADTRINYDNGAWVARDFSLLNDNDYSEIKISFSNFAITQILLCFKKTTVNKAERALAKHRKDMETNYRKMLAHTRVNDDLRDYYKSNNDKELLESLITPRNRVLNIDIAEGETKPISVSFTNRSFMNVFSYGPNIPLGLYPLTLATFQEVNRESKFYTDDWFSISRPSATFKNTTINNNDRKNRLTSKALPGDVFNYNFTIKAPNKPGNYREKFVLVFEGLGVVTSSVFELNINVKSENNKSKKYKLISPKEYYELIGLSNNPKNKQFIEAFDGWLRIFAKTTFRIRLLMSPYEMEIFMETFSKDNSIKIYDHRLVKRKISNSINYYRIQINKPANSQADSGKIIFVIANPRSGNTAITEALSGSLGANNISAHAIENIDYSKVDDLTFIKCHVLYRDFQNQTSNAIDYKTLSITRNPLDVILSAFRFNQKTKFTDNWVDGLVFKNTNQFKGKTPISKEFETWATGPGAKALLSVTYSWIDKADVVIRYEDFIDQPHHTIKKAIQDLGLESRSSEASIKKSVDYVKNEFLVGYFNGHRWTADKDNWQKYIKPEIAKKIYKTHTKVFQKLGYEINFDNKYSTEQIIENNKNWNKK